ncbi:DUF3822 family protein [Urechidicola sp. KH5]
MNGFSFCVKDSISNKIIALETVENTEALSTPQLQLDFLKEQLESHVIFKNAFKKLVVLHSNALNSLVPKVLFKKDNIAEYLQFNVKLLTNEFVTHDPIEYTEIVNVYIPFVHLNNYLFDVFGSFDYKHTGTALIELLAPLQKHESKTKVFVHIEGKQFQMVVYKAGELELHNSFSFNNKEDFVYYILFVFEQLNLNPDSVALELLGDIEKDSELYELLFHYVRHVSFFEQDLSALSSGITINGHESPTLIHTVSCA